MPRPKVSSAQRSTSVSPHGYTACLKIMWFEFELLNWCSGCIPAWLFLVYVYTYIYIRYDNIYIVYYIYIICIYICIYQIYNIYIYVCIYIIYDIYAIYIYMIYIYREREMQSYTVYMYKLVISHPEQLWFILHSVQVTQPGTECRDGPWKCLRNLGGSPQTFFWSWRTP
jgi:hypothetical protein